MDGRNLRSSNRRLAIPIFGLLIALAGAACSGGAGGGGGSSASTITLAAVDNPSMADLKKLVPDFESSHSGIKGNIVTLPEDQLRRHVTQDVAAKSGRYDLFSIGTYEVPLWAKKGWIEFFFQADAGIRYYKVTGVQPCFFLQAEDGIRDYKVTGVQTCALPI